MSRILEIAENKRHYDGATREERMRACHTPAVSVALIEDFHICEACAFGVKRRGARAYAAADTLFQAGSISKPVFAAAVARLAERGMLGMDTDICEYLIDYEVPTYDSQRHKVTLRQILNHNAGSTCTDSLLTCKGRKCPRLRKYETARPPQITRD